VYTNADPRRYEDPNTVETGLSTSSFLFHTKSHLTDPTLDIGLVTLTYLVSTRLFLLAVDLIISMDFLVYGFSGSKSLLLDQWMYQMFIYGSTNPQVTYSDQEYNSKDP